MGNIYYRLQELQFELYVAKQIKDKDRQEEIQKKIDELEKEIKGE